MNQYKQIMKREFKRISERKTIYMLSIFFPVFLFFIYTMIYKKEVVRELPVGICDFDKSELSRTAVKFIESSSAMSIKKYCNSVREIEESFKDGDIQGAFIIPENFSQDIKSGEQTSIVVYKNSSNIIVSNMILKEASVIVKTMSGGVILKKLKSAGLNSEQAKDIIQPIKLNTHSLYNSNYSYESYLVPALITFTMQLLIMISAVIIISSEFTHETFPELLKIASGKLHVILFAKAIPHLLLHATSGIFSIAVIMPLFNIQINGSIIGAILFTVYFVAVCLFVGLMISALFHDQMFATEVAVFINTPAFILSGFTFPIWAMTSALSLLAQLMPFTHFINGFIKVFQMNLSISVLLPEFIILSSFLLGSIIITLLAMKRQVNKYYFGYNDQTALVVK